MFHKIARGYLKTVEGICITLLFIIFLLMVIQVVCRLFTIGQNFTEELARICFLSDDLSGSSPDAGRRR